MKVILVIGASSPVIHTVDEPLLIEDYVSVSGREPIKELVETKEFQEIHSLKFSNLVCELLDDELLESKELLSYYADQSKELLIAYRSLKWYPSGFT